MAWLTTSGLLNLSQNCTSFVHLHFKYHISKLMSFRRDAFPLYGSSVLQFCQTDGFITSQERWPRRDKVLGAIHTVFKNLGINSWAIIILKGYNAKYLCKILFTGRLEIFNEMACFRKVSEPLNCGEVSNTS